MYIFPWIIQHWNMTRKTNYVNIYICGHLLELCMESFVYFPWFTVHFYLMALVGIHMKFHVAIIPQHYNLLPNGMCPTREQMGLCIVAHAEIQKVQRQCWLLSWIHQWTSIFCLTFFLYQPTTTQNKTFGQFEHS